MLSKHAYSLLTQTTDVTIQDRTYTLYDVLDSCSTCEVILIHEAQLTYTPRESVQPRVQQRQSPL
jgi:hypothetical protein